MYLIQWRADIMFRIRESFPDKSTVYLWFNGRLSGEDLDTAQNIISTYLKEEKKIFINLSNLTHIEWVGKQFLTKIKDKVIFEDKPIHLTIEKEN